MNPESILADAFRVQAQAYNRRADYYEATGKKTHADHYRSMACQYMDMADETEREAA